MKQKLDKIEFINQSNLDQDFNKIIFDMKFENT